MHQTNQGSLTVSEDEAISDFQDPWPMAMFVPDTRRQRQKASTRLRRKE
jgi:hypothetical protein